MARLSQIPNAKLDLASANVLIVGDRPSEQDILAQMLMGFGVSGIQRCTTAEEGLRIVDRETIDLSLVDGGMKESSGHWMISEIRRQSKEAARHLPIVLVCGHLRRSDIFKARDCGANFVLTKPIVPQVLFDRIVWLARDQRQFIECDTYVGPDRRVKAYGPPLGIPGRRHDDLSEHVGAAREENLSQGAIDGFFGATKVTI